MNPPGPELRDIHMPADPSWWPPAPGWWMLAVIVIGLLTWLLLWLRTRNRRRQWQQRIMAELDHISANATLRSDPPRLIGELSQLLRRSGRLIDANSSALRGTAWLAFLDGQLGGEEFSQGSGRIFLDGPYQRQVDFDADAVFALVRRWLSHVLESRGSHV